MKTTIEWTIAAAVQARTDPGTGPPPATPQSGPGRPGRGCDLGRHRRADHGVPGGGDVGGLPEDVEVDRVDDQPEGRADRVGVTSRRSRRGPGAAGDAGAGLIATLSGLLVFLALLLFAVQTLVALHTRSVVTDAAYEGARAVAGARVDHTDPAAVADAQADAEAKVRSLLGRFGDRVALDWSGTTPDSVAPHRPGPPAGLPVGRSPRARARRSSTAPCRSGWRSSGDRQRGRRPRCLARRRRPGRRHRGAPVRAADLRRRHAARRQRLGRGRRQARRHQRGS